MLAIVVWTVKQGVASRHSASVEPFTTPIIWRIEGIPIAMTNRTIMLRMTHIILNIVGNHIIPLEITVSTQAVAAGNGRAIRTSIGTTTGMRRK